MKKVWAIAADATRGRVLTASPDGRELTDIEDFLNPEGRMREREITTDLSGRGGGTHTGGHNLGEGRPKKEAAKKELAHRVAERIAKGRQSGEFERLFLVAAPDMLGLLRDALDTASRKCVAGEVAKDLAGADAAAIRAELPTRLWPIEDD